MEVITMVGELLNSFFETSCSRGLCWGLDGHGVTAGRKPSRSQSRFDLQALMENVSEFISNSVLSPPSLCSDGSLMQRKDITKSFFPCARKQSCPAGDWIGA